MSTEFQTIEIPIQYQPAVEMVLTWLGSGYTECQIREAINHEKYADIFGDFEKQKVIEYAEIALDNLAAPGAKARTIGWALNCAGQLYKKALEIGKYKSGISVLKEIVQIANKNLE